MLHRVPNGQGGFTLYVNAYLAGTLFAAVVVVGLFATMFIRSQPCYEARAQRDYWQAEAWRLGHEKEVLEPFAIRGIGLAGAEYRAVADRLLERERRGQLHSPFRWVIDK